MALTLLISVGTIASCSDDPNTEEKPLVVSFNVELKSVSAASAEVTVLSEGITRVAWIVGTQKINDSNVIFATGRSEEITSNEQVLTIGGLQPESSYVVSFAAETVKEKIYNEVLSVELTTTDFSDEYTLFDIDYRSAKIHVKVPEAVRERGNVLKWGFCDFAFYNSGVSDAQKINMHDDDYHNYFTEDRLFTLDNSPENQSPSMPGGGYDEDYPYYEAIYPNQDCYFMVGEFAYVSEDEMGHWIVDEEGDEIYVDFTNGYHEPGYYNPLFNERAWQEAYGGSTPTKPRSNWRATPLAEKVLPDQSQFWTGYYLLVNFKTKAPEKMEGEVQVDLSGLTPNGGEIRLSPNGKQIRSYIAYVLTPEAWENIQNTVKDPSNMADVQAYMTSYKCQSSNPVYWYTGEASIPVNECINFPDSETDYTIAIIGMGDDEGTKQFFQVSTFRLPVSTLDKPESSVEWVEELTTERSLFFRVKCPTKNAAGTAYAFNYSREWNTLLEAGYAIEDIVASSYAYFQAEEMEFINSEEGYLVEFRGLEPGLSFTCGVLCLNADGFYDKGVLAEGRTLPRATPQRLESPYFESLKGEWTLTATIAYEVYDNKTLTWSPATTVRKSRVEIGDITLPGLSEEDYNTASRNYYGPISREEMDAIYSEVREALPAYHESVRAQNYILCQGYDLYPWLYDRGFSSTGYNSPHALLTNRYYSYYDATTLFFEYGPKWYFEVDAEGNLSVPFSFYHLDPNYAFEGYYLCGLSSQKSGAENGNYNLLPAGVENGNWAVGHFPVTFKDEDTIVIEPYEYNGEKYYAHLVNIVVNANGQLQPSTGARIISEITLTRGWDEKDHPAYQEPSRANLLERSASSVKPIQLSCELPAKMPEVGVRTITSFESLKRN